MRIFFFCSISPSFYPPNLFPPIYLLEFPLKPDQHGIPSLMKCFHLSFPDGRTCRKSLSQGIPEFPVFGQPIVQMRPCGKTGRSHISDDLFLPHLHSLSDPGAETGKMTIIGHITIDMAQDHLVSISIVPPARGNGSICHGPDRCSRWSRIIHTEMRPQSSQDGMEACPAEFRADPVKP